MTSLNGYIQGLGSGADRIVRKTGTTVKLSVYDNIDSVIVFNEEGETSQKTLTGKNLFNPDQTVTDNSYLDANGAIQSTTGWKVSDYIEVNSSTNYYFKPNSTTGNSAKGAFYDSSQNFISSFNSGAIAITTPSNCKYVRFSFRDTSYDIQLEKGSTATPYEEYCGGIPSPNPDYPQDIEGIGVKQLDDTYSVTINYDDGDGRTGSVIASGLAYPLYEGDVLDFANGKVIRRNNYYTYSSAQYYGTFGADNAPLYYVMITDYNTKPIKNMQNSTFLGRLYSNMLVKITASSTPNMNNNEIRTEGAATPSRFYFRADQFADLTDLNNHLSNNNLIVAAELQNPVDEYITLTGDISDIGTATVTADGTLTVKYDKVEMAIRKYS